MMHLRAGQRRGQSGVCVLCVNILCWYQLFREDSSTVFSCVLTLVCHVGLKDGQGEVNMGYISVQPLPHNVQICTKTLKLQAPFEQSSSQFPPTYNLPKALTNDNIQNKPAGCKAPPTDAMQLQKLALLLAAGLSQAKAAAVPDSSHHNVGDTQARAAAVPDDSHHNVGDLVDDDHVVVFKRHVPGYGTIHYGAHRDDDVSEVDWEAAWHATEENPYVSTTNVTTTSRPSKRGMTCLDATSEPFVDCSGGMLAKAYICWWVIDYFKAHPKRALPPPIKAAWFTVDDPNGYKGKRTCAVAWSQPIPGLVAEQLIKVAEKSAVDCYYRSPEWYSSYADDILINGVCVSQCLSSQTNCD